MRSWQVAKDIQILQEHKRFGQYNFTYKKIKLGSLAPHIDDFD